MQSVKDRPKLRLDIVESLKVGVTPRADAWRTLGVPDLRLSPDRVRKTEQWFYFEGDGASSPRLLVNFTPGTWVLNSIVWDIRSEDPESDFQRLMSRYPKARFVSAGAAVDAADNVEVKHVDRALGATISVDKETGRATMIVWE